MSDYAAVNRANWDDRVPIHMASAFYDVEGWLARRPGPRKRELDALGDVAGLDLVHLQCHFGLDTLAFATAGAQVTGLDLSGAAIAEARALAVRAGLADRARFVEGDVLEAASLLAPATFDIVYVSLGALCWLPSVERWATQVGALLRPGGRLYIHDGHPLANAFADDAFVIENTYFEQAAPHVDDWDQTYTDGDGRVAHTVAYEWNHGIGEIVNAIVGAGMRVDQLIEHDWTVWPRFPFLVRGEDDEWHIPPDKPRVPLTFTVLATKQENPTS